MPYTVDLLAPRNTTHAELHSAITRFRQRLDERMGGRLEEALRLVGSPDIAARLDAAQLDLAEAWADAFDDATAAGLGEIGHPGEVHFEVSLGAPRPSGVVLSAQDTPPAGPPDNDPWQTTMRLDCQTLSITA